MKINEIINEEGDGLIGPKPSVKRAKKPVSDVIPAIKPGKAGMKKAAAAVARTEKKNQRVDKAAERVRTQQSKLSDLLKKPV